MPQRFRIADALWGTLTIALCLALWRFVVVDDVPIYLHLYGSFAADSHDLDRPADGPKSVGYDRPWTRVATLDVYSGRPFGFYTPNNRDPAIELSGELTQGFDSIYRGELTLLHDDVNLTFDSTEVVALRPGQIVEVDPVYVIYLLSNDGDPYTALESALRKNDDTHSSGE